jgi:putative restriction endonuclease
MSLRGFICPTDEGWYEMLCAEDNLDEVNFWQPTARSSFRALSPGAPLLFKLKKAHGHAIVGFGFFAAYQPMSVRDAWDFFGVGNGARTLLDMRTRLRKYARGPGALAPLTHTIGCILLTCPVFFPRGLWVDRPADWKDQIVRGKGYDLTVGEGARIWKDCMAAARSMDLREPVAAQVDLGEQARLGKARLVAPRLGQGTFRVAVRDAYRQCAVTGEHALPALDAAHIRPFADDGPHTVQNGLLLRADIHRLFDGGYVTVTPDYTFEVSGALDEEFGNGKLYYQMEGSPIHLPDAHDLRPDQTYLEHHRDQIFLGH